MMFYKSLLSKPAEHEAEKASNSYLVSLVALVGGLPLPIVHLLASLIFYISQRKAAYFVRWHCTQTLVSQLSFLLINSVAFWWTVSILLGNKPVQNSYIAYMLTVILFSIAEFLATIYTAIQTRKGHHVRWWFYADLTDRLCKP